MTILRDWTTSSYSQNGGDCVELRVIADEGVAVQVRDTKNRTGPVLSFPAGAFAAFVERVTR